MTEDSSVRRSNQTIDMTGAGSSFGWVIAVLGVVALILVTVGALMLASPSTTETTEALSENAPEEQGRTGPLALSEMTPEQRAADIANALAAQESAEKALAAEEAKRKPRSPERAYRPGMSDGDVERLTTYAVALGRGVACGLDTSTARVAVGKWIDAKMPAGSPDRSALFPIFMQGIASHAELQARGASPDNCDAVKRQFVMMPWP